MLYMAAIIAASRPLTGEGNACATKGWRECFAWSSQWLLTSFGSEPSGVPTAFIIGPSNRPFMKIHATAPMLTAGTLRMIGCMGAV